MFADDRTAVQPTVLVVDDEDTVRMVLRRALQGLGYRVLLASGGREAIALVNTEDIDVLVLDVGMPEIDGLEVLRHVRAEPRLAHLPCLLLTGLDTIGDKVVGFDLGADDYVTKPFELIELDLKIKALLRRSKVVPPSVLRGGGVELYLPSRRAVVRGQSVVLTKVECDLLEALMVADGAVISTAQLLQSVWGYPSGTGNRGLVRMHLLNLRRKLELDPQHPQVILTVPRHGYRLAV